MDSSRKIFPTLSTETKTTLFLSGMWVLLNLAMKAKFLGANDIALDEPFSIFHAQQSLGDLQEIFKRENNPPLHFWVLHFWIKWFGLSPTSVRAPFMIFSSLAAGVTYWVGKRHFGQAAGIAAALMFTFSTQQVYFAHEARTYGLFILLTALSVGSYLRAASEPEAKSSWFWLTAWNILLLYTHFLALPLLAVQAAGIWLLFPNRKQSFLRWLISSAAVVAVWFPQLILFFQRLNYVAAEKGTWVEKPKMAELYQQLAGFLNGGWGLIAAFALVVLVFGLMIYRKRFPKLDTHRAGWLVTFVFLATYLGLFVQSQLFTGAFLDRYLVFLAIPFYWVLAGWLAKIGEGWAKWAVFAPIILWMALQLDLNPPNQRKIEAVVEEVEQNRKFNDPVLICTYNLEWNYLYYFDLEIFKDYKGAQRKFFATNHHALGRWADFDLGLLAGAQKVWVVDSGCDKPFPGSALDSTFRAHFSKVRHHFFPAVFDLYEFSVPRIDSLPLPQ